MDWKIFIDKGETYDNHTFLPEGFCARVAVDCCREITLVIRRHSFSRLIVEFLSYVNFHFHFTLMQKFKFWYHLEGNSIRNNFGPSVQRSFQLGGQGAPPGGAIHRTYGNRCIS